MAARKKKGQALAIKLSRERRAGKKIPPPPKGQYSDRTRNRAIRDNEIGQERKKSRTAKKSRTEKKSPAAKKSRTAKKSGTAKKSRTPNKARARKTRARKS
jgi:hypothetical protein